MSPRDGRRLAIVAAVVFVISSIFPVVAGLWRNTATLPRLWGMLDVVVAFVLMVLAIAVSALFDRAVNEEIRRATYRAYRSSINAPLFLLVVFFLAGDRVIWNVLLPGLAWRAWLFFYAFPPWLAALRSDSAAKT